MVADLLESSLWQRMSYPSRIFDVDDIILNGIGILIGMIIFKILKEQQKIYDFIGEKIVWNTQKQ